MPAYVGVFPYVSRDCPTITWLPFRFAADRNKFIIQVAIRVVRMCSGTVFGWGPTWGTVRWVTLRWSGWVGW